MFFSSAQQFSFEVVTSGFSPSEKVYLKKYHGKEEILIDSISGSKKGEFQINTSIPAKGLYFIVGPKNSLAELIYSPEEKMKVAVDKDKLKEGKIQVDNSPENVAYQKFLKAYMEYDYSFNPIVAEKYNEFDPQFISKTQMRSDKMVGIQSSANQQFDAIATEYSNTYTGAVLANMVQLPLLSDSEFDNYQAFLFKHYWDEVDFSKTEMLNHFMLNEMLKNYYRNFVPKHPDSMKVAIVLVLDKTKDNPNIQQHVRSFLLTNFLRSNADDLTLYIMNKGDGETCDLNLSEDLLRKFEAMKSLAVGSMIPEANLPNPEMNKVSLKEVYEANKLTLVVFWTSHCSRCQAELPELRTLYETYNENGFQVYAINLDENKFPWRDAIKQMNLNWVNVTDEVPLKDSQVLVEFNVVKTPQTFLVNRKGEILAKNIHSIDLEGKLKELLKQE